MTVMLYTDSTHSKKRPVVLCAAKGRKEPHNRGDRERVRWRSEGFHKRNRPLADLGPEGCLPRASSDIRFSSHEKVDIV